MTSKTSSLQDRPRTPGKFGAGTPLQERRPERAEGQEDGKYDRPDDGLQAAIVLVRPREEGNVGSVARAMANMGLRELILVEPAQSIAGVARGFGVGGWEILDAIQRVSILEEAIVPFRRVVGTTSARERGLRQARVLTPRQMATLLCADSRNTPAAASSSGDLSTVFVFGSENTGLSREELDLCHPIVSIPTAVDHPTLNLAQAVVILAYELFAARSEILAPSPAPATSEPPAPAAEVAGLMEQVGATLRDTGFDDREIHAGLMRDLRRLLKRSDASSHEVRVLRRIVNRARQRLVRGRDSMG